MTAIKKCSRKKKFVDIFLLTFYQFPPSGSANALSLSGYSDREIQKMGRWKSNIFKEYISGQLSDFSEGMSKSMKKVFKSVNIKGGMNSDITSTMVNASYAPPASASYTITRLHGPPPGPAHANGRGIRRKKGNVIVHQEIKEE